MRSDPLVAHRRCPSKERERGGGREGGTINAAHRRCPSRPSLARFYGRRQPMPPDASVHAANRCRQLLLCIPPTNAADCFCGCCQKAIRALGVDQAAHRRSSLRRPALGARSGLYGSSLGEPHRRQIWLVHRRLCGLSIGAAAGDPWNLLAATRRCLGAGKAVLAATRRCLGAGICACGG